MGTHHAAPAGLPNTSHTPIVGLTVHNKHIPHTSLTSTPATLLPKLISTTAWTDLCAQACQGPLAWPHFVSDVAPLSYGPWPRAPSRASSLCLDHWTGTRDHPLGSRIAEPSFAEFIARQAASELRGVLLAPRPGAQTFDARRGLVLEVLPFRQKRPCILING